MINFEISNPNFQEYHGPVAIITYTFFFINPATEYQESADHISLMIGYVAMAYIVSTYLTFKWEKTFIGQLISCVIVYEYYVN